MNYHLPASLSQDIKKFAKLATGYREQKVSQTEFKAFRVPMGVYEQRKNEIYMARIRATGGFITPEQFLQIIDIAQRGGSNLLHLTTRAEIQILNLSLEKVESVLLDLQKAGLATKGGGGNTVRNILVSEFSGISDNEVFDTTPYAMALTNAVVPETDSYLMPRKMKIAFSSDADFTDYAGINDVGLVAKMKDGKRGFKVYIGGGAGSKPSVGWLYREFLPAEDLYALVKGMKDFFNAHGNRKDKYKARIRFIFYKLGKEQAFRLIDEYVEKVKATGVTLDVREDAFPHSKAGNMTTVLPFTWGNIQLEDQQQVNKLKAILNFAAKYGEHTVRFTPRQNVRFRNIPADAFEEFEALLKDYAPAYNKPMLLNNIVSCTGADTCRLGICLSKGLADAIYKSLEQSGIDLSYLDDARINISGCPNLCGQPLWTDLGFVGKVLHTDHVYPAYQIYIGANYISTPKLAESIGNVNAYDIPKFTVDLIRKFAEVAETAESLGMEVHFGKWLSSPAGKKAAVSLARKYSHVPLFSEDKNYYFDWGSDEVFNITKRGKPECSAGLFDMITVDKQNIADYRGKSSYNVVFYASRMLLVTRGLDPQTPEAVFDAFVEHFIESGYVSKTYLPLIQQAKQEGERGQYDETTAGALADAVIELYDSMDDALQFQKPALTDEPPAASSTNATVSPTEEASDVDSNLAPDTSVGTSVSITRSKDLRGVLCPMNFVRTKLELASLQSGDVLEILLDDGKPIENVPGSVRIEGHTVFSELQQPDGHWQVLIQKK